MPWPPARYPPAMEHLPLEVRLRAIEIANALLDSGHDGGQSIRMAIAAAKRWAGIEHTRPSLAERTFERARFR